MNRMIHVAAFAACLAAAGCNEPRADAADEAKKTAAVLTGDDKMAAADNPQCKLFNPAELQAYVGESLEGGTNAAMGTGCQWPASDDSGDVMVVVIPPDYHTPPTLAEGYKELPDVGTKGYVVPEMGGWAAGAVVGADAVKVSVAGEKASADMAVALLKETIKRRSGS